MIRLYLDFMHFNSLIEREVEKIQFDVICHENTFTFFYLIIHSIDIIE